MQAAKTYLERHFDGFASASLDQLIAHALRALDASLQDDSISKSNCVLGVVGPDLPFTLLENEDLAAHVSGLQEGQPGSQHVLLHRVARAVHPAVHSCHAFLLSSSFSTPQTDLHAKAHAAGDVSAECTRGCENTLSVPLCQQAQLKVHAMSAVQGMMRQRRAVQLPWNHERLIDGPTTPLGPYHHIQIALSSTSRLSIG